MTTTIACFSGGKDSTAMLLLMMERGERIDGLLVTPTGNELPEVWGHWSRMAALVGAPVVRPKGPTLADLITAHDALPNHRQRWCTRQIKIEPAIAWSKANPGATLCVGLRADEEARSGIISTSVPSRFPLREAGWGICDVQAAIARHGITVPKRTDCAVCYEQRIGEWFELWRDHPEQWAQGEAWEAATGRTFRSPHPSIPGRSGRDTWPAAMRDMAARFAVEPPARGLKLLQRDREGQACRVCSL
jgi:hypothetical protein